MTSATIYRAVLIIILTLCGVDDARGQKVGSTSMQFLKVMPSARGAALGEAYSVLGSGADAVHWNPAGIVHVNGHEFGATYINWLMDARQGSFAYAFRLGRLGALGFQLQYVDFGEFEETTNERPFINNPDAPGLTGRTFRPNSILIGTAFARELTDRFAIGFGIKYARESLFDQATVSAAVRQGTIEDVNTWASGLLFDFGIRYATGFRSIEVASVVQNFGPDVTYAVESYPVPLMFRVGISGNLIGREALFITGNPNTRVRAAVDLFHPNDYAQQLHGGIEYTYLEVFSLRGGYKFFYDSDGLTLGAGVSPSFGSTAVSVDYSFGSMGTYLGNVQRVSLGVSIR